MRNGPNPGWIDQSPSKPILTRSLNLLWSRYSAIWKWIKKLSLKNSKRYNLIVSLILVWLLPFHILLSTFILWLLSFILILILLLSCDFYLVSWLKLILCFVLPWMNGNLCGHNLQPHQGKGEICSHKMWPHPGKGNVSATPYAFTEQGFAMLSGILNSEKAISVNIAIMRAFVMVRQYALTYKDLTERLREIESKFSDVYEAINYLLNKDRLETEQRQRKRIGFYKDSNKNSEWK